MNLTTFSWEQFCELLLAWYVSIMVVDDLANEFLELKQGNFSAIEYVTKFNRLVPSTPQSFMMENLLIMSWIQLLGMRTQRKCMKSKTQKSDCMFVARKKQRVVGSREVLTLSCVHGVPSGDFDGIYLNCGEVGHIIHRCHFPIWLVDKCYRYGLDGHRSRPLMMQWLLELPLVEIPCTLCQTCVVIFFAYISTCYLAYVALTILVKLWLWTPLIMTLVINL